MSKPSRPEAVAGTESLLVGRRRFLKAGLMGSAVLVTSGVAVNIAQKESPSAHPGYLWLQLQDVAFLSAILPALLKGSIPEGNEGKPSVIRGLQQLDNNISRMSPAVQHELRKLFDVATGPLTKGITTGIWQPWEQVTPAMAETFLQRWRTSRLALFRMAYSSINQLSLMAWHETRSAWLHLGFSGPPHSNILVTATNRY
ncbi:hypothetical protein [Kistimonas asteriae]|uniref:hypothetical protein n=1 Tax=Kistimonas asteriae TaxID=517724 RepID=UPI001BA4649B|nr:hypothetical protein [Kistimonas asteriae]